jgi:hypothetical protein
MSMHIMNRNRAHVIYILLALVRAATSWASPSRLEPREEACRALASTDFAHIVDAPTHITDSKLLGASEGLPAHCEAHGYVAPSTGLILVMPATGWNGKLLEMGCSGFCGEAELTYASRSYSKQLKRGYSVVVFAGAHDDLSAAWAYNDLQAQIDFGIRAPHVAALAAKAITEQYFKAAPAKSYFWGCSTGGQQALAEAQRFPWDFDGIIAGAPSPTFSGPMMYYLWNARALKGTVSRDDLKLVHDRAVAQCDMDDGVKDGVIGDPLHCKFDPAELLCKTGKHTECLTKVQIDAVKKVYAGPTTSKGEKLYTGGPLPGSELNWITDELSGAYISGGVAEPWAKEYFSYVGFMPAPGPDWKVEDFDFDRDYKRLRISESLFGAADNPDLRKFKGAGGKMLMYQGGQDQSDIPSDAIDYYQTTEKTMGGRAPTQAFFRLFLIPGMNHCEGGAGASDIDYLTYLEAWVEQGRPPDQMVGAHVNIDQFLKTHDWRDANFATEMEHLRNDSKNVEFTRPVYPYPTTAKYRGSGDPKNAASFGPAGPH